VNSPMNRHEFEARYSEAQIRRSTWAYVRITLRRGLGWQWRLGMCALALVWAWLAINAAKSWAVWIVLVILASFALFLAVAWQIYIRNSLERLSRMKVPVARVVADDDNLAINSDIGSATLPWTAFTEAIDGPGAIYLRAGKGAMINLPIDGVDPRAVQFIRERIAANSKTSDGVLERD
jgi:hypothetical protein